MLRAVVVLALVAVAVATSPFIDPSVNAPEFSAAGSQIRFVPRGSRVLAVPAATANGFGLQNGGAYRVVSVGPSADAPTAPIRKYYGNVGRERFQDISGRGQAAAGSLALSLDPTASDRIIRDTRLQSLSQVVPVAPSLVVPEYTRHYKSLAINANDVVLATTVSRLYTHSGFSGGQSGNADPNYSFFVINTDNVVGVYTSGLFLNGQAYASGFQGNFRGSL